MDRQAPQCRKETVSGRRMGAEKDYSILVGRMKGNAKDAVKKLYHCPSWTEIRRQIPKAFRKLEQHAKTWKKELKWQSGIVTKPFSESQWNSGLLSLKKRESEKHNSCDFQAEGFQGHVATDGSLLGVAGKWTACSWSVVQWDYDEELEIFVWDVWLDGGTA